MLIEIAAQVTDIVDAMILRRLLESLMEAGVVFVMTSKYVLSEFTVSASDLNFLPAATQTTCTRMEYRDLVSYPA
jgi:predicted ATPase